ncbi:MAG: TolC family protein [Prevotellaceae bacterium]|jgi:outer membrane protein TolC|nr:TolC family protein [Prevotellaceae bacterium]
MKNLFSIFIFLISFNLSAQFITIDECHKKAKENYPLIRQYDLIERSKEYTLSNITKGYFPQFQINAKATYQSDVTSIPISVPNMDIPKISKDQYNASIEVSQILWDGGSIGAQKKIVAVGTEVDKQQLQVNLYAVEMKINQLFFGILLLDSQLEQNRIFQEELNINCSTVENYIENGIAGASDLDAVKVELLNAKQNRIQLQSTRQAYMDMLSYMIGEKFNAHTQLIKPDISKWLLPNGINRPELQWFELQNKMFTLHKDLLKTGYMPKFNFFLQGGIGRPALNMFSRNFDTYYVGGIRLSWNFGALYTRKNDLQKIDIQQHIVDSKRETFLYDLQLEITHQNHDITRLKEQMQYDDEIIALRKNIKQTAETKLANGTITVADWMHEVNRENIARQTKILHEIELMISIYSLKHATNE